MHLVLEKTEHALPDDQTNEFNERLGLHGRGRMHSAAARSQEGFVGTKELFRTVTTVIELVGFLRAHVFACDDAEITAALDLLFDRLSFLMR